MSSHRVYRLKARADRQRQTRERIVAATEALHREVGPARTTIADIARRAGVERLTVYNHFPELAELLGACQASFLTRRPPPDISPGGCAKRDALDRLELALRELYAWFRANEALERNIHRDRHLLPELDRLLRRNADPVFDRAAKDYATLLASTPRSVQAVTTMIRLALDFQTWHLVTRSGASDSDAARLLVRAVAGVANRAGRGSLARRRVRSLHDAHRHARGR
jgi:AcrR family transcriptional regulator